MRRKPFSSFESGVRVGLSAFDAEHGLVRGVGLCSFGGDAGEFASPDVDRSEGVGLGHEDNSVVEARFVEDPFRDRGGYGTTSGSFKPA